MNDEKKTKEREVIINGDIVDIVNELIQYNNQGEVVFTMFDGNRIYSNDLSMSAKRALINWYSKRDQNYIIYPVDKTKNDKDELCSEEKKSATPMFPEELKDGNTIWRPLERVIESLVCEGLIGNNVYYDYKAYKADKTCEVHRLYSCDVTSNGAYKEIYGMTKAEYDKIKSDRKKFHDLYSKKFDELQKALVPYLIREGLNVIDPRKSKEWEEIVTINWDLPGNVIDFSIKLMKELKSGKTLEDVKKILDNPTEDYDPKYGIVQDIISRVFNGRGSEFLSYCREKQVQEGKRKLTPASIEAAAAKVTQTEFNTATSYISTARGEQEVNKDENDITQADE